MKNSKKKQDTTEKYIEMFTKNRYPSDLVDVSDLEKVLKNVKEEK